MAKSFVRGRVKLFDYVRLYGYPGRFEVLATINDLYDFHAKPLGSDNRGFSALSSDVVEINGKPVPLMSAPLVPPANDYPHNPTFDYSDGPKSLAMSAMRNWAPKA